MKNIIERIAGGAKIARYLPKAVSTRLAVAALAALAAGGAWAVTANVVWESDFGTSTKTGLDGKTYTLSLPNGCSSWLQNDGTIKIGSNDNSQGATIDVTGGVSGQKISVLMEYEGATAQSAAVPVYIAAGAWLGSQTKDNSLEVTGHWWNGGGVAYPQNGDTVTTMPKDGYFMYVFAQGDNVEIYSAETLAGMSDASAGGAVSGLNTANRVVNKIALGGVMIGGAGASLTSRPVNEFTGLVIKRVAIFTSKISASEAAAYKFPSDETKVTVTEANTSWSTAFPSWDDSADNSDKTLFIEIQEGASLSKDTALSVKGLFVTGLGSLTLSGAVTASNGITIGSGATVSISANTGSAITNYGTLNADGVSFTGAITNNGTFNTSGTVSFSSSVVNKFNSPGSLNVLSGTTTCASKNNQIFTDGTVINISKNATLVNNRDDMLSWGGTIHVYVRGTLTMNQKSTIGANNYIHLYDGALIDGDTNTNGLFFNTGEGDIVAEEGSSTITAPITKSNGTIKIEVKDGATLSTTSTPAIATKAGNGLLLKRIAPNSRWGGGAPATNYDGVELVSTGARTNNDSETFRNSSYTGYVKVTTDDTNYRSFAWVGASDFTNPVFSDRPTFELNGDVRIYHSTSDKPFTVKNLSGTGYIRNFNTSDSNVYKYIDVLQTKDTAFSGIFKVTANATYTKGDPALTVRGADDATSIYSLTLSGVSDTTAPLTVENNAKVIFSSTGKWSGGTVTVASGGVLESQNSESIADRLVVQEGATLKFANGVPLAAEAYDWNGVSSDEAVKIDLGDISPSTTPVTLIASDVTVAASKFKVTASQRTATLSVENGALKATFANLWTNGSWSATPVANDSATLVLSQNSTLTVSEALTLGTVTVVKEGEDDVKLTISGAGALTTGGWTIPAGVTVNTADGMSISGTVAGGGVINVPANTTLTMDGVTTPGADLADRVKVAVFGTLKTKGTTTLSAANTSAAGSLIEVVADTTTLSSAFKGLSGNITIDSDAELSWAESIGSNSKDQYYDHINPDGTTVLDIAGTLHQNYRMTEFGANNKVLLRAGALVDGSTGSEDLNSYYGYGHWTWLNSGLGLHAYGNAELAIYIRTPENVAPEFTVDENAVLTISKAFIPQTGRQSGAGSIVKAGAGTLKLSNIAMTKPIMAGTGDIGTVELTSTSGNKEHTATGSTFNGILHLTNTSSNQHIFRTTAAAFADGVRPEWILDSSDTYFSSDYYPGKVFYVRNLSGSGTFKAQYTSGNLVYTINTMQERNTVFSGIFTSDGSRSSCLTVVGDGSGTVNSLTLQNASSSTNTLSVSDNAKVVFASNGSTSGKWANGRVVVNANGWLESSISDAVKNLTLASGSHLVFPTESTAWTGITNITSTGTIDCSIGNGNTPAVGAYLINWTGAGLASAPGGTYSMSGAAAATVALKADTTGLKVVSPAASLTKSTGVTSSYADTMSALADFISSRTTDIGCYVTILGDSEPLDDASLRTYQLVYDSSSKTYRHAVARIGAQETGVFYSSLATALASAVGGETVTLMFNNTDASITIPANVTLEIPAAYSISGTIAGAGAVDAKADFAPTFGEWTGTFIMDWADTANTKSTKIAFDKYGISGSTVQLNQNYKGWLANTAGNGVASDIQPTVILNATLHVADGYSKNPDGADAWNDTTKFSKLKSTSNGQLSLEGTPGGSGYKYYFHIDTLESFEGSITINGNYCLKIGKYNFPDYASASSFVVGTKLVALTYTTGSTIYNSSLQDPATAGIDVAMLGSTIQGNKLVYDTDGFYPAAAAVLISETTNYYKTYAAAAEAAVAAEVRRMTGTDVMGAGSWPSGWYPEGAQTGTYVLPVASAEVTIDDPYVYGSTTVETRYYASLADAIAAVDSEGTVTLMDNTGEAISLGKSIALNGDSYTFSGTFTGSGTVILDGASLAGASSSTWPAGWTGTVWLTNNVSGTQIFPANYGNANSVLKFTGVTGWLANGTTIASAVELEDDGDTKALTLNYTSASETTLTFKEFRGSGTFATSGADGIWPKSTFQVLKWDDFDGALSIDRGRLEFGTDTISTDDWCYIYVSSGETVAVPAGKTWYARDGVRVNGTLNVDATATLAHLNGGTGKLSGTGRVVLGAVRSSALTFGTWTGTVVLPAISETEGGIHFDWYGKAGSTIEIDKGFSGWLNASSDDTRNVKANLLISNGCQFTIVGTNSGTTYGFAKISGNGNFHLRQTNQPNSFTIGMLDGYSGTIVNDDDDGGTPTTLTIQKVKLAAAPTPGDKLVGTTTPDALTVATTGEFGVYVGNTQQSVSLAKGVDGIYAALVSVTKGDDPTTYYATVSDAMTAAGSDAATITLLGNTDSNVSLAVGQSLVTDGFSVGTVSTGAEHCHVVDNAGVYTVALDQFAVTIPSVANTTVIVSYTSGGVAQVATAAGDIMVDYGTDVTATWTAVSGYRITSGASETLNGVTSVQTLAPPTVEAMGATVSNVSVSYGADYASATVTATVSDTTLDYYISWAGGEPVRGSVSGSGSQVTFDVSGINHTTEYQSAGYTITAKDGETDVTTTGGSGTSVAADTTPWFSHDSSGLTGGTWATAVDLSEPATVADNKFTATAESTSSRVVLEFNVCFSSVSDADVDGEAQAAIKIGEVESAATFMVLASNAAWTPVSRGDFVPDASATYKVVMTIDYGNGSYGVTVGDNVLTNASGSASFPLAKSGATSVQTIDFAGSGTLKSMKGDQVEGYMVKDNAGHWYATIQEATQAYNSANGPYTVLHSGTAPSGWKIDGNTLIKLAKGFFFMAY